MVAPLIRESIIRAALLEDLGPAGRDITTEALVPPNVKTIAVMRAREAGVAAGLKVAEMVFKLLDPALLVTIHVKNGDKVSKNERMMTVKGAAASILMGERVALNFVAHLSGIATLTRKYVDLAKGTSARIRCTRKTLPGLRELEKEAVRAGGGFNHRFGLYDAVLIKDNHILVANSIKVALERARAEVGPGVPLEIEVDTLQQLQEVLKHDVADILLLDNMDINTLKKAVAIAKGKIVTEASGGITLKNARAIAQTGVDYIAVGALTHSAPALDIGLDIDL